MNSLTSSTPHLVQTLTSSLSQSTSPSESILALNCFNSYLSAGQLSHPELSILYPLLISHLSNPDTIVSACSAIEELIERSNGFSTTGGGGSGVTKFMNRSRCSELIEGWVSSQYVTSLIHSTVQEAREEGGAADEVDDDALAIFKLITTLSEYFISTYLFDAAPTTPNTPASLTLLSPPIHTLLSILITLTTFPGNSPDSSYTINELSNGSWMALQEYGADQGYTLNGIKEGGERGMREWEVYKGVFKALSEGLRARAVRPELREFMSWPKGSSARSAYSRRSCGLIRDTLSNRYQRCVQSLSKYGSDRYCSILLLCSEGGDASVVDRVSESADQRGSSSRGDRWFRGESALDSLSLYQQLIGLVNMTQGVGSYLLHSQLSIRMRSRHSTLKFPFLLDFLDRFHIYDPHLNLSILPILFLPSRSTPNPALSPSLPPNNLPQTTRILLNLVPLVPRSSMPSSSYSIRRLLFTRTQIDRTSREEFERSL